MASKSNEECADKRVQDKKATPHPLLFGAVAKMRMASNLTPDLPSMLRPVCSRYLYSLRLSHSRSLLDYNHLR